ncbi:MAG: hypothetical protein IK144_03910 [Bacteroidaceae bacterium]|nr:hypothetical protein [Bacteroidaceae bacterium]
MELTKADKRQLKDIIRRGILRRCEEWLKETSELINKEYGDDENAFDRCMEVTKRSRDYFKEAMRREDYYRNTMMLSGTGVLLAEGYLTLEDIKDCREEVQTSIKFWARMDE